MKKHITLVCDGLHCKSELHTGQEKNHDARVFAMKLYDWASAPDYAPGGGGRHIDLCSGCKYTWIRPGGDFPLFTRLKPHELDALQKANLL